VRPHPDPGDPERGEPERAGPERGGPDGPADFDEQVIEVVPVVVLSRPFPARPSSIPDIRDFVRSCLSRSPLGEDDKRRVFETVSQALLDAAGPEGGINVSFRIFPDHVEVDVLRTDPRMDPEAPGSWPMAWADGSAGTAGTAGTAAGSGARAPGAGSNDTSGSAPSSTDPPPEQGFGIERDGENDQPFAHWMSDVMQRQGLSMEATARQLGVSVKTIGRWIGGTTEPRLRDLRRIRELFGETPLG
jgi:hypothetical protein